MKRLLLIAAALFGAARSAQGGGEPGAIFRMDAAPVWERAGFLRIPFSQVRVRGGETLETAGNRVIRWRRLERSAGAASARKELTRRFGAPERERFRRLPNGEPWREAVWRTAGGCRAILRWREREPGAFLEITLEDASVASPVPGAIPAVPQPVMPGACRAAVIATLARCAGIDLPAPLAAAAWQGGEARGVAPLFRAAGAEYRMVEIARDRIVNERASAWFAAYNRRAVRAGLPLLTVYEEGNGRLAWEEAAAAADPVLAAGIPVPDAAGLARFRREIADSLAAGFPLGWTLRRRSFGARHRRLIIGFDADTDRILILDLFPPYTPRLMPLTAAWCQTLAWQVFQKRGER